MRATTTLLTLLLVSACGGGEEAAPAEEAEPMAEAAAPSMADFAGTWQASSMLEGVADPVMITLEVSDDGTQWVMLFEGRDPVGVTPSMSGDSIVMVTESYESVLQDGVMVSVRTASVMESEDRMVGNVVATYDTPDGERQVPGSFVAVRGGM